MPSFLTTTNPDILALAPDSCIINKSLILATVPPFVDGSVVAVVWSKGTYIPSVALRPFNNFGSITTFPVPPDAGSIVALKAKKVDPLAVSPVKALWSVVGPAPYLAFSVA